MVSVEQVRKAADILRQQNGGGPILGFSFDNGAEGVTVDYDESRDIADICLEAFVEAINQAAEGEAPPKRLLSVVREG